jgi:hypothetical protein
LHKVPPAAAADALYRGPDRDLQRGTLLALFEVTEERSAMKGTKLLGVVFLALGLLALAYGGFSYTKDTDRVNLGPVHLEVKDRERVNIPLWAGVGMAIVGGVLLARKS